jgi:hypothetical protein
VKLIAEYLERAHQFERLAAHETDPKLKSNLEKQARAYRKLAEKRTDCRCQRIKKYSNDYSFLGR